MISSVARWGVMAQKESQDGLRAYLRALRMGRKETQAGLADAIGLSRRAYIDWETGETHELKTGPLIRAIIHLRASLRHVEHLVGSSATAKEGAALAEEWLGASAERRLQELSETDPGSVAKAIEDLRALRAGLERLERQIGLEPVTGNG